MPASPHFPAATLGWVLAAQTAVLLPHLPRLPPWLSVLCLICLGARVLMQRGRLSFPGAWLKTALVAAVVAALVLEYGRGLLSVDAVVGVLILGLALKLLEMRQRRDVLILILLCYFTVLAQFLYSQSIPVALYMGVCLLLITAALVSLHQSPAGRHPRRTLGLAGRLLLQSMPLMLVFFLLFPRIAPLWSVPAPEEGITGLDDSMAPGEIGQLARSAAVAFRVEFTSEPPPFEALYWRGLTLDSFDGREWRRGEGRFDDDAQSLAANPRRVQDWFRQIEYVDGAVNYEVILEPTGQPWLFTLKLPRLRDDDLLMRPDYQVERRRDINQRYRYQARSYPRHRTAPPGSAQLRDALALPARGNERSRALARRLARDSEGGRALIEAALGHFREQAFFYTLSPPVLEDDPVDGFLFDTREGFCEHYAGAFTFLMRAAGLPARVVVGYQGGEFNPYDDTLTVRQYDAHAWSEVWLEDEGWVRVDPTAAVAPERVRQGGELTLQTEPAFLEGAGFSMLRFRHHRLLNALRLRLDSINHAWNRFVLNYNRDLQWQLLGRLFGSALDERRLLQLMVVVAALLTAGMGWLLLRRPAGRGGDPATLLYLRFCRSLAKAGYRRRTGETPRQYCRRIGREAPHWAADVEAITTLYADLAYRPPPDARRAARTRRALRAAIRRFRWRRLFRRLFVTRRPHSDNTKKT